MRVVAKDVPDFEAPAYFVGRAANVKLADFWGWVFVRFCHDDFTYIDATEIAATTIAALRETRNNFTSMPVITDPAFETIGKYGVVDEGF
jgi:hypothetical protein